VTKAGKRKEKPASQAKKLKLKKETVKDLDPKARGVDVKGGEPYTFGQGCES